MMSKFKVVFMALHGILMMFTFAVVYVYFAEEAGRELPFVLPEIFYPIVMVGVVWASVATALFHVVGGGILGATAGGVLMGMKMGLFLGLAYAIGRLWLYLGAAFGASVLYWPDFKWSIISLGIATVICLVIQRVTNFVWSRVDGE